MIERLLKAQISTFMETTPKSLLLLGARQTGKSTLIKTLSPDFYLNLSDERTYLSHLRDPGLLNRLLEAQRPSPKLAFIDEIQRIPSMLNTIQTLIDDRHLRFILTGSSARKLKRGEANLLPGRILSLFLHPLCFWEINQEWNQDRLKRCLISGCLPEVFLQDYGADLLTSYVDSYLREEIQAEALTKDLGAYSRFLDVAALLSGQYLNYSQISSDTEINKETVRRYFTILEETLLIHRIESFSETKTDRKVRQKDKFIFFDLGVRNAILRKQYSEFSQPEAGELFEQWIMLQVLAYKTYYKKNWRISSFRDEYGTEVDLIIETDKRAHAFEIKYSDKFKNSWGKGCRVLSKIARKKVSKHVIYTGTQMQMTDDQLTVLPYVRFLSEYLGSLQ